jgi:hypothetical protein
VFANGFPPAEICIVRDCSVACGDPALLLAHFDTRLCPVAAAHRSPAPRRPSPVKESANRRLRLRCGQSRSAPSGKSTLAELWTWNRPLSSHWGLLNDESVPRSRRKWNQCAFVQTCDNFRSNKCCDDVWLSPTGRRHWCKHPIAKTICPRMFLFEMKL